MRKEDKQFFIDLIKGVEGKVDGLEGRFDGLEGRFDGLEGRFDGLEGRFDGLEGRFDKLEDQVGRNYEAIQKNSELIQKNSELIQKNSEEIRHNGVLIEDVQSDVKALREGQIVTNHRLDNLESDVRDIKETISDYPILRETVKKHSHQLAKMS